MKTFRWYWLENAGDPLESDIPRLRAVSPTAPQRPRWSRLYGGLLAVAAFGGATHLLIPHPVLRAISDGGTALALLTVFLGWVHVNRVALARAAEPDAGTGKPRVRIVRSRRR